LYFFSNIVSVEALVNFVARGGDIQNSLGVPFLPAQLIKEVIQPIAQRLELYRLYPPPTVEQFPYNTIIDGSVQIKNADIIKFPNNEFPIIDTSDLITKFRTYVIRVLAITGVSAPILLLHGLMKWGKSKALRLLFPTVLVQCFK